MAGLAAAQRPNAPSTCDPGAVVVGDGAGSRQVVERPAVHVAGLEAHDRRADGARRQHAGEVGDVDRTLVVGGHGLDDVGAQAEEAQGAVDRGVPLAVGHHAHRRAAGEAAALDVPAHGGEHVVAGRGEGHGVGGLAAGHESERRLGGEPEQVLEPATGDVLDHRGSGRGERVERRLVPADGEDVRRGGRVERAADDEPEVPGPGGGDERRLDRVGELADDIGRRGRPIGERAQASPQLVEVDAGGEHRHVGRPVTVRRSPGRGVDEEITQGGHVPILPSAWPTRPGSSVPRRTQTPSSPGRRPGPHGRAVSPCPPGRRGNGRRRAAERAPTASPRPPVRRRWLCAGVRSRPRSR